MLTAVIYKIHKFSIHVFQINYSVSYYWFHLQHLYFLKTFDSEFSDIGSWFTDQDPLEIGNNATTNITITKYRQKNINLIEPRGYRNIDQNITKNLSNKKLATEALDLTRNKIYRKTKSKSKPSEIWKNSKHQQVFYKVRTFFCIKQ